jgi:hypothetical protein
VDSASVSVVSVADVAIPAIATAAAATAAAATITTATAAINVAAQIVYSSLLVIHLEFALHASNKWDGLGKEEKGCCTRKCVSWKSTATTNAASQALLLGCKPPLVTKRNTMIPLISCFSYSVR